MNTITLTEDEFDEQFPLLVNHLNPSAGWAIGEQGGCLFETYGEELAFVRRQAPDFVWTLIDGDEGLSVVSGPHFVNRVGYLLSTTPVPENTFIEVRLDTSQDETDEAL